jgi:hypothetical protein
MSGVPPGQRGLRSKTSELFRDRASNTSRLQKQDYHLVPPVPSFTTPDSNKPKRKLALWGKRRKSGSVSPSQSARPSGDSTNLLRGSGETSGSPYRTVQTLFARRVRSTRRHGVSLTRSTRVVVRILRQLGCLRNSLLWMCLHHLSISLLLCLHSLVIK